LNFSILKL